MPIFWASEQNTQALKRCSLLLVRTFTSFIYGLCWDVRFCVTKKEFGFIAMALQVYLYFCVIPVQLFQFSGIGFGMCLKSLFLD